MLAQHGGERRIMLGQVPVQVSQAHQAVHVGVFAGDEGAAARATEARCGEVSPEAHAFLRKRIQVR